MARCTRGERRRATCDGMPHPGLGCVYPTRRVRAERGHRAGGTRHCCDHCGPAGGRHDGPTSSAILALALGILVGAGSVPALVLGYIARRQIDRSGGRQTGRRLAVAAIVLGWVGVGVLVVSFAFGFAAGADGS